VFYLFFGNNIVHIKRKKVFHQKVIGRQSGIEAEQLQAPFPVPASPGFKPGFQLASGIETFLF